MISNQFHHNQQSEKYSKKYIHYKEFQISITALVSAITKRNSIPEASSSNQSISSSVSTNVKVITDNTTCDKNTSHSIGKSREDSNGKKEQQPAPKSTGKRG